MKSLVRIILVVGMKLIAGVGIAILLWGAANAQGPGNEQEPATAKGLVMQRNLSLAMAKNIAETSLAACQAKGYHTSVVVVDRAGQVIVVLRDEQATAHLTEMARRKAYTARMYHTTTLEFRQHTIDPVYAAQRDVPDILALGGGAPIQVGNETIGGVGSAGSSQEQDDSCAKAGITKVADLLK
jgi:uncharacterized protein GlcG (DUF336 family)